MKLMAIAAEIGWSNGLTHAQLALMGISIACLIGGGVVVEWMRNHEEGLSRAALLVCIVLGVAFGLYVGTHIQHFTSYAVTVIYWGYWWCCCFC